MLDRAGDPEALPRKLSTITTSNGPDATGSVSGKTSSGPNVGAIVGGKSRLPFAFLCSVGLKFGDYRRNWWSNRAPHHNRDHRVLHRSAQS